MPYGLLNSSVLRCLQKQDDDEDLCICNNTWMAADTVLSCRTTESECVGTCVKWAQSDNYLSKTDGKDGMRAAAVVIHVCGGRRPAGISLLK